jgi:hypothetical protein
MITIVMIITTRLRVIGMVEIAVTQLMQTLTKTFTVQSVLLVKSHHRIVWTPGLMMSIVMTTITKLLVNGMVRIAVASPILTQTRTATVKTVIACRQRPQQQLQPPIQQSPVKTKLKQVNAKSGSRSANAATMLLL